MGKTYLLVVMGILIAKMLGFFRDIIFASVFGASSYTDMYFQIFGLVNLLFTGIGVALSTLVIKNVNKIKPDDKEARKQYVSCFITKTFLISALVMMALYAVSGHLVRILLPGLDISLYGTASTLMHIMLPSLVFVLVAYVISGVLQNTGVFFITSIVSLPFNVAIIMSLFAKDVSIITVSVVTTFGWFLHILIQLPFFYKKGFRLFTFRLKSFEFGGNGEIVYIFISNMMFQLCFTIDKAFVSIESGAATTLNYASNLFITISSIFVVAMSNVVFPSISRNYEEKRMDYVKGFMQYIIKVMFAIFIPFALVVCCYGENIISLLYERGEFTKDLTSATSILFSIYTFGFLGYICQELFNKILYLDGKYKYTVAGAIAVVASKPLINIIALAFGGVYAVAISTTCLLSVYALNVFIALKKVTGSYITKNLLYDLGKIFASALFALAVFFAFKIFAPSYANGKFGFVIGIALCGAAYIAVLYATGVLKRLLKHKVGEEND